MKKQESNIDKLFYEKQWQKKGYKLINAEVYKIIKRVVDVIGALVGCVALIPLTICIQVFTSI